MEQMREKRKRIGKEIQEEKENKRRCNEKKRRIEMNSPKALTFKWKPTLASQR